VSRRARIVAATLNRISRQGDMHIRLRGSTWMEILFAAGLPWDTLDASGYREIDASALESVIRLGGLAR
jgi:hypothetical protein